MTLGVLSSSLFGDMFGTAAMRAVFGESTFLARCAEVRGGAPGREGRFVSVVKVWREYSK